jgi:hypothetical protein
MPRSEFFQKMKKKPALQAILDNLHHFTVDQLETVDQPKWIREELVKLKVEPERTASANQLADAMTHDPVEPQHSHFPVYRHTAPETFYETNNGGTFSFEIQIGEGDHFLLNPWEGCLRQGDHQNTLTTDSLHRLEANSQYVDDMTLDGYKTFYRERLNTLHGNAPETVVDNGDPNKTDTDDRGWFRIQRH